MSNLPYAVREYASLRQQASRHFGAREYEECQLALNVAQQYWQNTPPREREQGAKQVGIRP